MPGGSITIAPRYLNKDSDERLLSPEEMSDALNVRGISGDQGEGYVLKTTNGNLLKSHTLPSGTNTVIGTIPMEDTNKLYYFVANSSNNHSIVEYDSIADTIQEVLQSSVLNFSASNLIQGRGLILESGDTLLYFTDDSNPLRKINVQTALAGYPVAVTEEFIEVLKYPPINKPTFTFETDTGKAVNNVSGTAFQFSYRYIYDDGEVSAYSPYSDVAISDYYLQNSVYTSSQIDSNDNVIELTLQTGSAICDHIEVIFREGNTGDWKKIRRIDNDYTLGTTTLRFDNSGNYPVADTTDTNKLFDNVPQTAKTLELIGNRLVVGNYVDGYDNVEEVATSSDITIVPNYYKRIAYSTSSNIPDTQSVINIFGVGNQGQIDMDFSSYTPSTDDYVNISYSITFTWGFGSASGILFTSYIVQAGDTLNDVLQSILNQLTGLLFGGVEVNSFLSQVSGTTLRLVVRPAPYNSITFMNAASDSFYTQGNSASKKSFKAGANHPIGIAYYDRGNRSTTVQKPFQEGTYVKFFSERIGDEVEGRGQTELDLRIGSTPPEWATSYKILYTGNTTVDEFLQYTCLKAYKPRKAQQIISDARIYLAFRGFKSKEDSYRERLGALIDYNFQEGDRLRVISYSDPSTGNRIFAEGYLDFKIIGLEIYDQTNSPVIEPTNTSTTPPKPTPGDIYEQTGAFLIVEDPKIDGWKFDDVGTSNDNWYNNDKGAYFEIYRPHASVENEVYYETGYEFPIANPGTSSRLHEGNVRNQNSLAVNYSVTSTNYTQPTYIEISESIDDVALVNGDIINISATSPVTNKRVRKVESVSSSVSRIYIELEITDVIVPGNIVSLTPGKETAAIRIQGGDVWMKPRLLRQDNTSNTLDNYIDDAEDYYANDFFPTNSWDKGRVNAFSENSKQVNRYQSITYSDAFFTDTNDNGLSSFNTALANFKEFQNGYGSIQLLKRRGGELVCYQEDRVSRVLVNKNVLFTPEGESSVALSTNFISEPSYYAGDYGISLNPESFAEEDGRHFWVSAKRGKILRLGGDGITKISDYSMQSYFDDTLTSYLPSLSTAKIYGGFDRYNQEYFVSIPTGIDTVTLSFSDQANKWISRWSFIPEFYSGINMKFITFKNGGLYVHDVNGTQSNFYGVQYSSRFTISVNKNPQVVKTWRALELQGNKAWNVASVETNLVSSNIPKETFEDKEGFFYAQFLGATSGSFEGPFVGLGVVSAINSNVVTINGFDKGSVNVAVGDQVYVGSTLIGTITNIGDGEVTLSSVASLSLSDFVFVQKAGAIEGDAIKGYYAKLEMTQTETIPCEIFAVRAWVNFSTITSK